MLLGEATPAAAAAAVSCRCTTKASAKMHEGVGGWFELLGAAVLFLLVLGSLVFLDLVAAGLAAAAAGLAAAAAAWPRCLGRLLLRFVGGLRVFGNCFLPATRTFGRHS